MRGLRMPLGFPEAGLGTAADFRPAPGDIFVVSYPKCGTTWLQYIVWLLVRGRPLGADETLTGAFPHLEEVGAAAAASQAEPRLIKTHLQRALTPWSPAARYLLIVRNPFDCAVSFYHHTRGFPRHYDFADGSFADFFECFLAGEVDFGGFFEHLLSWQPVLDADNLLFLTYESLRADPVAGLRRIATFLGGAAEAAVASAASAATILAETSLPAMRREQQRWSSARPDWAPPFVREGRVGGWQDLMTPEQAARLLAEFDRRLGGTALAGLWPEQIAAARAFAARG